MLDSIRTLKSLFSKGGPEPVRPVSAALPMGYHSPREADVLCCSPLRKNCLQHIWESSSLPADVYKRLYLAPMNSLLARVQNVPAAEQGKWSYSDGFGDLTLQFTTCAVRMAKGYMFPPGAAPEEQAEQNVMWNAVIFWTALFWHLPLLASLQGELLDGKCWLPGINVPVLPYRFRFLKTESSQAFAALAAAQLMPAEGNGWLAENPAALNSLAGALWNRSPAMPLIRTLMKQAGEKIDSPLLGAGHVDLIDLSAGEFPENTTKVMAESTVLSQQVSSAQTEIHNPHFQPPSEVFSLASSVELTSEQNNPPTANCCNLSAQITPNETSEANATVANEVTDDTDALLSLFTGLGEIATDSGDEKGSEEKHFIDNQKLSVSEPPERIKKLENYAGKPPLINSDNSTVAFVNKYDERLRSEPKAVNGTGEVEGESFFDWLREGINRGEINFNGKDDKVHVIAGYVFLPVPGIFFDYLKTSGSSGERESIQASFEQLNLHKRRDNRRFYFAQLFDEEDKSGKFKRVKGYLVKSRQVFKKTVPQDSQFLLFP